MKGEAKHWRDRATEVRAIAEKMSDEQARRSMLKIAQGYEHLAERPESQAAAQPRD